MSYSISREAPIKMRRCRNRKTPPIRPIASSSAPYAASFSGVTPAVRSSIARPSTIGAASATARVMTTHARPSEKAVRYLRTYASSRRSGDTPASIIRAMPALYLIVPALAILAIAYRYYSVFIAKNIWVLDDTRVTPAHRKYDGANYYPTSRWVLFGSHFAAIAGSGPRIGPVLAAQFGYAPGLIWLVAGVCLAGAVQDSFWLWASTRRGGRSLADIARTDVGPVAGLTAGIAILFITVIAIAGLGLAVVNALAESAWGTFTIAITIPVAVFMGFYMFQWRPGRVAEATIVGVLIMMLAVVFGKDVAESSWGAWFVLSRHQLVIAMALYTIAASILPVWMLLTPRAYLSTFMKIGTIAFLVLGVIGLNPTLKP